jgi:hypothetical protein
MRFLRITHYPQCDETALTPEYLFNTLNRRIDAAVLFVETDVLFVDFVEMVDVVVKPEVFCFNNL